MLSVKSLRSERVGLASSDGCYGGRESVMSSALPEELWSDDEEHVVMETWSEDKTPVGHGKLIMSLLCSLTPLPPQSLPYSLTRLITVCCVLGEGRAYTSLD